MHPDALFLAVINMKAKDIVTLYEERSPIDKKESQKLECIKPAFDDSKTKKILENSRWIAGGKASLIRAIEVIEGLQRTHNNSWQDCFARLSEQD
jgi:hypothetical protein